MPSDRDRLKEGLARPTTAPAIQRGKGVHLSTTAAEKNAETQKRRNAETLEGVSAELRKRQNAIEPERTSRGFAIRADLVKAMKRIALDEDKKLYVVLEEAIEQYLTHHRAADTDTV